MASVSNITIDIRTAEMLGAMLHALDHDPRITAQDAFEHGGRAMARKHRLYARPKEFQADINFLVKLRAK